MVAPFNASRYPSAFSASSGETVSKIAPKMSSMGISVMLEREPSISSTMISSPFIRLETTPKDTLPNISKTGSLLASSLSSLSSYVYSCLTGS